MTTGLPHESRTRASQETPRPEPRAFPLAAHQHLTPGHQATDPGPGQEGKTHGGHGGHRWMMVACCIPMLVIVAALVASGAAGTGAIVFAVACLAMMWLMMRFMH